MEFFCSKHSCRVATKSLMTTDSHSKLKWPGREPSLIRKKACKSLCMDAYSILTMSEKVPGAYRQYLKQFQSDSSSALTTHCYQVCPSVLMSCGGLTHSHKPWCLVKGRVKSYYDVFPWQ